MNFFYNRYEIPKKFHKLHKPKEILSLVEALGLEMALESFYSEYCLENFGEKFQNLSDYTIKRDNRIEILDGCYNCIEVDNYIIKGAYITGVDCICLFGYKVPDDLIGEWHDRDEDEFEEVIIKIF